MFTVRKSKPSAGNKHFIRTTSGGWNSCITGKPTDKDCNVLSNCVGYANGRFNEIITELTGYQGNKYNTLNCNAENFIERAVKAGLEIGQIPKPGAIMCWMKGSTLSGDDGAGHVAVVEKVNSDNSVYTSESAYNGAAFFNATRTTSNGRWGMGTGYSFRGFIYNPAVKDEPAPTPEPVKDEFKVGDKVVPTRLVNYKGTHLKQYDDFYYITELKGDRAVCSAKRNGKYIIWAAMNTADLKKL